MRKSSTRFSRGQAVAAVMIAAAAAAMVLLALNAGSLPHLQDSAVFTALQFIVAVNTIGYAFLGWMKIGAKRPRPRPAPVRVD